MEGLRVSDIQFRGPADGEHLQELLAQKTNEPLDKRKLRRSIQALYATGRFSDIQVEADRLQDNQVALVFIAEENFFVGSLTLEGAPRRSPSASQLLNATKLELGELFTTDKVDRGIERMKAVLQENGFYLAHVEPHYTRYPEAQLVGVHFVLARGERARVGKVSVSGNPGFSEAEVRRFSDLDEGEEVTPERVTRALQKIRRKYQKQDRLVAQVSLVDRTYDPDSNTVDFHFRIERGPTVDIHVEGTRLSKRLLRRYVPVFEENAVDDALLNEGRRNIRDYLQTRGYFDADVDYALERVPEKDHLHVIYRVELGEQHELAAISIQGNRFFRDWELLERMRIQESGGLLSSGRFSQSMLDNDLEAIEDLYRSVGFRQAEARSRVEDSYQGEHGRLRVVIEVEEGPVSIVESFTVRGNQSISTEELFFDVQEDQPYSETKVARDREAILNQYFNAGFPEVAFAWEAQQAPGEQPCESPALRERMCRLVSVAYTIHEGPRVFVDQIHVSGLRYTLPHVVWREFQIKEGGPLDRDAMYRTQSRLYDMGIFNEVNIAVQNPEGGTQRKSLVMQVEEAQRYTFNYGLGFEVQTGGGFDTTQPEGQTDFSPRFSFDVTRLNFRGRDHTLSVKTRVSRIQQRLLFGYEAPRFFGEEKLKLNFSAFYDTTRDVRTFTAQRLEGSAQVEHRVDRVNTLVYRFSYRRVKVDDLVIDPQQLQLLSRPVRVGMPSVSYIRDRRDDPLHPTKNNFTTVDLGASTRFFGSEASFGRLAIQNATYHSFTYGRAQWVLARSTRLGFAEPFSSVEIIPLPERFFAGGASSHRGFGVNQAGPRDAETGFPLGGGALFLNNVELRTPPILLPFVEDNLSFVLFHDMGNVFASAKDLRQGLFRVKQRPILPCQTADSPERCNFNFMSHAAGAGLRYRTPVGPVRVDFGYNLNPPHFPVRAQDRVQRLDRFNFYFSIGPTF